MKQFSFVLFMVGALLMSFAASAQEVSFRNGVITGISPIQVAAAQSSQRQSATKSAAGRAFGRSLGRLAGRAMAKVGGGEYAGRPKPNSAQDAGRESAIAGGQDFAGSGPLESSRSCRVTAMPHAVPSAGFPVRPRLVYGISKRINQPMLSRAVWL